MRRRLGVLDEHVLVHIFSKLHDARLLARCAMVSRQWRQLAWAVSRIDFNFTVKNQDELLESEDIIFSVLHTISRKSPGFLRFLVVEFKDDPNTNLGSVMEAKCHWLTTVSSAQLQALRLSAGSHVQWGAAVWRVASSCNTLLTLQVLGIPQVRIPKLEISLRELVWCSLKSFPFPRVSELLAACPKLDYLKIWTSITGNAPFSSGSIRTLSICCRGTTSAGVQLTLDMPRLTFLTVDCVDLLRLVNTPNLCRLISYSHCLLDSRCESLQSLEIFDWKPAEVVNVLAHAPMLTELCFAHEGIANNDAMDMSMLFFPLQRLRKLTISSNCLKCCRGFENYSRGFHGLTVHVKVSGNIFDIFDMDAVKPMFKSRILLVLHCEEIIASDMTRLKSDLFELLYFFPERVKIEC